MRTTILLAVSLFCAAVVHTSATGSVAAEDLTSEREREARAEFEAGVAAAQAGDYTGARAHFLRSRQLVVKASTLLNLALADLKLGLFEEALFALDAIEAPTQGPQHDRLIGRARLVRAEIEALRESAPKETAQAERESLEEPSSEQRVSSSDVPPSEEPLELTPLSPPSESPITALKYASPKRDESPRSLAGPRTLIVVGGALGAAAIGNALWWGERNARYEQCVRPEGLQCLERATIDRERMAALALTLSLSVAALASIPSGLVWLARRKDQHAKRLQVSLWSSRGTLGLHAHGHF